MLAVFDLLPLFSRLLLTSQPMPPELYSAYLERWFPLLLLYLLWTVMRVSVPKLAALSGRRRAAWLLASAVCAVLFMLTLQVIKLRHSVPFFYLTLLAIALDAIAEAARRRALLNIALRFLAQTAAGYLALQAVQFAWAWQALLFSGGLSGALAALHAAAALAETCRSPAQPEKSADNSSWLAQTYPLLLFLGPTLIAMLGFSRRLSVNYVLIYLVAPLAARLVTQVRLGLSPAQTTSFMLRNYSYCLLFVVILLLLGIVS